MWIFHIGWQSYCLFVTWQNIFRLFLTFFTISVLFTTLLYNFLLSLHPQLTVCRTMTSEFTATILRWFSTNRRDLPWRETKDPYAIWLSEIILQQTRIQQGQAYWERFMHRWPTVKDLAEATEDEVLREWQGLGYYSRARNLHTAAQQIVANGEFPTTFDGLRKLKGVGDYTAAAIASIAFDQPTAVVDGNVYRVLARYFGIDTPINTTEGKKLFTALAQEQISGLPGESGISGLYNQAMMDFGAIQCTPQSPNCLSCPLAETCDALHSQRINQLPVKLKKLKIRERHFCYYYIRLQENGSIRIAIRRRPSGDIWQGLWEPLMLEDCSKLPDIRGTFTLLRQKVKHVLTHQIIYADFYLIDTTEKPQLPDSFIWIPESELSRYALPRLIERLIHDPEIYLA